MQDTTPTPPRRRHTAFGRKINWALGFLAVTGAYVGWVVMTPRITAYELESQMTAVCTALMNATMYENSDLAKNWQKEWQRRHRKLGIPLNADQWQFTTSEDCHHKRGCTCRGEAVFELETPWFILEDYLDMPKYKTTHHISRDAEFRTSY